MTEITGYARDIFYLFFEMPGTLCVTVMTTQNYRWYQLEGGSPSEFGKYSDWRLFSPGIFIPHFLTTPNRRSVPSYGRAQLPSPKSIGDGA